jgi:hypothetical protein
MIWRLLPFVLVAILVAGVLVSDVLACKSDRTSKGRLTGEDLKDQLLQGRESFAMMDEPRTMRFLSPVKAQRMKNLHPKPFEEKAQGIDYPEEAPELQKLPPLATPKLSQ